MELRSAISAYVPDRPPTWTEVGLGVLLLVVYGPQVVFDPPSIPAFLIGFFAFATALGPLSRTTTGARIGDWFRRIGVGGRAAVIVLFAVVTVWAFTLESVPAATIADAAVGGLLACVLFLLIHVLLAGDVSGWSTTDQ